ncbi:MAG TPA: sensor histidine kinase [Gammaproteobacteria bacterium]|nr:sensor histidine kinase [Gammaproteobacteria bacterium]
MGSPDRSTVRAIKRSDGAQSDTLEDYMPNLGRSDVTIQILLLAEGVAIVVELSRYSEWSSQVWNEFVAISSFCQVLALAGIFSMKLLASVLRKLPARTGSVVIFCALLVMTYLVTEGLFLFFYSMHWIPVVQPSWQHSFVLKTMTISSLIYLIALRYIVLAHRVRMEMKSKQTFELQALQSRIRPHFIFNSMNGIASLITIDPTLAEKALEDLADVFRTMLADARTLVPLASEIQLLRQYLDIETLRLGDRLRLEWQLTEVPEEALIPSLTLQPLLENAVYHGIEPSQEGGIVRISICGEGQNLLIHISNPLPSRQHNSAHQGHKIALRNVRLRLQRHFHGQATMQAGEESGEEGGEYHVRLRLPLTYEVDRV